MFTPARGSRRWPEDFRGLIVSPRGFTRVDIGFAIGDTYAVAGLKFYGVFLDRNVESDAEVLKAGGGYTAASLPRRISNRRPPPVEVVLSPG